MYSINYRDDDYDFSYYYYCCVLIKLTYLSQGSTADPEVVIFSDLHQEAPKSVDITTCTLVFIVSPYIQISSQFRENIHGDILAAPLKQWD